MKYLGILPAKLRLLAVMSSLWAASAWPGAAHEVTPTIGDLGVSDGRLELALRLNAEALVAGVELHAVTDTDQSAVAADYDALRVLPPEDLAARLAEFAAQWPLVIRAETPLDWEVVTVEVPPAGDLALPRATRLVLGADLPAGTDAVSVAWPAGAGDLVLRQQGVETPFTGLVRGGSESPRIPLAGGSDRGGWSVFAEYIPVGFTHILPKGLDHILFVLGLFFLSTRLGPLVWQISAFTLAHTVTLALGATGWVSVPATIVEPLIAASITYVAVENLFSRGLTPWRPVVIFGFGLLHGLGFASVLEEFGLPEGQFVPALIGFNVGVEIGQLTVVALAFLAVGLWFRNKPWYRARIAVPASVVIALIGAYWFVERVI